MVQASSDRSANRSFHRRARSRCSAIRPVRSDAQWCSSFFRPRLELLEDRVYPGDTLLGIWALGLWGSAFASRDVASASYGAALGGEWRHGHSTLDPVSVSAIALLGDSQGEADHGDRLGDGTAIVPAFGTVREPD